MAGVLLVLVYSKAVEQPSKADSEKIVRLNKKSYQNRLIDATQSYKDAAMALNMAKKVGYTNGEAEAYRMMGLSKYYSDQSNEAIKYYLKALHLYKTIGNILGEAKVLNNIGTLYYLNNYEKALSYFNNALQKAKLVHNPELSASIYLNMGNVWLRKKLYSKAIEFYEKSESLYKTANNQIGIIQCLQNTGRTYLEMGNLEKAEEYLQKALTGAQKGQLNSTIASIKLGLSSIYIAKKEYKKALITIQNGLSFAKLAQDKKMVYDFYYTTYELETKRKNYERALAYLRLAYKQDSVNYTANESDKISLMVNQAKQQELLRKKELTIVKQEKNRIILVLSLILTLCLAVIIFVLLRINRITRHKNQEIERQKDHLQQINAFLERSILKQEQKVKIKDQKLSELNIHLGHEVKGPISTMKEIMDLEAEKAISHKELVEKMKICIHVLESKLKRLSAFLQNPKPRGLYGD